MGRGKRLHVGTGPRHVGARDRLQPVRPFWVGHAPRVVEPRACQHGRSGVRDARQRVARRPAASAAGLANPTFQVSAHSQRMHLSEGERTSNAWTGGPGNMGLVVKKPRSNSALSLGLTPLTSKAFSVQRVAEDSLVGHFARTLRRDRRCGPCPRRIESRMARQDVDPSWRRQRVGDPPWLGRGGAG